MDRIGFTLVSLENFADGAIASAVIQRLFSTPEALQATKYGAFQPATYDVSPANINAIVGVWLNSQSNTANLKLGPEVGSLILERNQVVEFQVAWQRSSDSFLPFIGGSVDSSLLRTNQALLHAYFSLIKDLANLTNAAYGEIRNMEYPGWDAPFDLNLRLPDIPWVSIYGPPYVDFFGLDRLSNAPFAGSVALSPHRLWLQASESVFEPVPEEAKKAITEHLGEESFMSGRHRRYKTGKAPRLQPR